MIPAALEAGIPLIIGTAGGSGGKIHVNLTVNIIKEIIREKSLSFKLAIINSEFEKDFIKKNLRMGKISPLYPAEQINEEDIDNAIRIVAQMGEEPFIEALNNGADIIIAGRAYDPSVFSALAIKEGFDKGLAIHMGKILECAAIAAIPGSGSDCMFGYLRHDCFVLEPLSPLRRCTTLSVAAHTLYEKSNPYLLPGPGGAIDLQDCKFEQIDDNKVRVSGSKFIPTPEYFVKLEGVRKVGYRTISCAGVKDPIMITEIDNITKSVTERVRNNFENYGIENFFLDFKVYGKNAVMGMFDNFDKGDESVSNELLIIIEAVAATQEQADTICGFARSTLLHFGYEGRISTAGNLAFPFSPSDSKMGEVYEFSIYHLMKVDDPINIFPISYLQF
jgi:hypothetical protein